MEASIKGWPLTSKYQRTQARTKHPSSDNKMSSPHEEERYLPKTKYGGRRRRRRRREIERRERRKKSGTKTCLFVVQNYS